MTFEGIFQLVLYMAVLIALAKPIGSYMANVYTGQPHLLGRICGPLERGLYRLLGTREDEEMDWKTYAVAVLLFSVASFIMVYALQRLQGALPLNPAAMPGVTPDASFNTAVSFATNTNWQGYGGETTMSYLTQMAALTVQNFVSAAVGMAVLVALVRGLVRRSGSTLGNFWSDLVKTTLYILLPLSTLLALILVSQGVLQNFGAYVPANLLQATKDTSGTAVTGQVLPMGPVASQIAIKQLGTNGGGYFNVNSAHPFENPTPLSNFFETLAILLIPVALCYTYGKLAGDTRQGWAVLIAMTIIFVPLLLGVYAAESDGNPAFTKLGVDQTASALQPGGNMEGKETRFGIADSALWAAATTAASNGSVNSMHDSYTPLGGLVPMWLMQLGEVIYGGVGSGLYGMLHFIIIAVFVGGLMVGRTPEYLGKKIESFEMKMSSIVLLIPVCLVLVGTAIAVASDAGKAGIANPGPHGFSEVLYAFSSAGNNNGSAFAGLSANNPFYNLTLGVVMFISRYWIIVPTLALSGSMVRKKTAPAGLGTLPTHTPLFIILLIGIVIIVGALSFIPALALGPIVEHLQMTAR